jgi:hypothetical protein
MTSSRQPAAGRPARRLVGGAALALLTAAGSCGGAPLNWYASCGDPVCHGYTPKAGVAQCTTEQLGAACTTANATCDPTDSCNVLYVCTTSDPQTAPGGCPI